MCSYMQNYTNFAAIDQSKFSLLRFCRKTKSCHIREWVTLKHWQKIMSICELRHKLQITCFKKFLPLLLRNEPIDSHQKINPLFLFIRNTLLVNQLWDIAAFLYCHCKLKICLSFGLLVRHDIKILPSTLEYRDFHITATTYTRHIVD